MQEHTLLDRELGNILRERRLELEWSVEQTSLLYGEAVRGNPVTRKAYLRMEEGYLPKSPKRRMVLAAMLGLTSLTLGLPELLVSNSAEPLTFVSRPIKTKTLNLREYRTALLTYWKQGYRSDPSAVMKNIAQRIQVLHNNVLYTSSSEKVLMKQLLCGFHIRYGHIAREQGFEKAAVEHFRKAVILAHEERYIELEAAALHHYGSYFFDKGDFKNASLQLKASLECNAAPWIQGCTLALCGFTQACVATSNEEIKGALNLIDASEKKLREPEDDIGQVVLTPDSFLLFKARTLVASPLKKLRIPNKAEEATTECLKQMQTDAKRHAAYRKLESSIVLSQVWLDREYYPIATTLAQDSLKLGEELESDIHLQFVDRIYTSLKTSSYGKDMEVAKLGIQLTKLKHIQMFSN